MQSLEIDMDVIENFVDLNSSFPIVNDLCERAVQLATLYNNKGPKTEKETGLLYHHQRSTKSVADYGKFYKQQKATHNNESSSLLALK